MRRQTSFVALLVLLGCALGIAGCGGDQAPPASPASSNLRQVEGAIVKGPLVGATVAFFNIDEAGQPAGLPILTATTDALGHISTGLPAGDEPLLAVSSGGSYVDESDDAGGASRRRITLGEDEGFSAIVPADADTFCMTPYSMALLLRARRLANGANFLEAYDAVRTQATSVFGFDPTTVIPGDPLAPDLQGDPEAAQYALMLGGAAYAINAIAVGLGVAPSYEIILAFIADLSDGTLDGEVEGDQIDVKALIGDVDLNAEILRFRNNHFQLYNNLLARVNEEDWSEDPPLPGNLPPFARIDTILVAEGGTSSALVGGATSVLANDSDTGGASLVAALVAPPSHGSLEFNPDGTFKYEHDGSETIADMFTYRVSNGAQNSAPAVVLIEVTPVNDAPVAAEDSYAGTEGIPLNIPEPGVLGNDTDAEAPAGLTAVLQGGPAHGSLALAADGGFIYTPAQRFSGEDSFTYRASDGAKLSQVTTVILRIADVNSAPIAVNDAFNAVQDVTLIVPAPGVNGNDTDPDGDSLSAVLVNGPAGGLLKLSPNGGFSYKPPPGFTGQASFQYQVTDGVASSNPATVRINVGANSPPVARDDFYPFYGDPIVAPDPDGDPARQGIFDNDTDPDGDPFTAELLTDVSNGTLVFDGQDGSFVYTPDPPDNNFKASRLGVQDEFTYRLFDGYSYSEPATVTIGSIVCDCAVDNAR